MSRVNPIPQGVTVQDRHAKKPFAESEFWNTLMEGVYGQRQGGAKVLVDAEDSKLGSGKTSAAVALARACAKAFGYNLTPEDFTLSGQEYLRRYREHPDSDQPSVICLDELVGAGSGDSRRAMSSQNVDLARIWTLIRKKRIVTIATLPDFSEADKRLKKLADFRVQCLRKPFGSFRSYELGTHFDGRTGIKFSRLDPDSRIHFPDVAGHDDPLYNHLTERKDALLDSGATDADELVADEEDDQLSREKIEWLAEVKHALKLVEPWHEDGMSYKDAAKKVDYGDSWIGNRVDEWRDGQYRDMVDDPTD